MYFPAGSEMSVDKPFCFSYKPSGSLTPHSPLISMGPVWIKTTQPAGPSQEGLHPQGGLDGVQSLAFPGNAGNWLCPQGSPEGTRKSWESCSKFFSAVCRRISFLPQKSALCFWEVASIWSRMRPALGWSLMAFCQLPRQFRALRQCTVWGSSDQDSRPDVLLPSRQHSTPAPLFRVWGGIRSSSEGRRQQGEKI